MKQKRLALLPIAALAGVLLVGAGLKSGQWQFESVTIASSGTTSTEVDTKHMKLGLIKFPAAFTGATVTFHCSEESGGTFAEIVDGTGSAVSVTATDGKWVSTSSIAGSLAPCRFLKIVSASSEAAERTLVLTSKE